ncbi:MAG: bifunctional 2',3'-cyclic-nucleotide 2'-phosphodiesterase/3'-nucleotidase [Paracoccaceae bacterium]
MVTRLRLLATSDIHAHILPYDYAADLPRPNVGLARTADLIRRARAEEPNCLLFDNGDFLEGSLLGQLAAFGEGDKSGGDHPVIAAMNATGYDAVGLGNHEFSFGIPFLERCLQQANFPVLCSNLVRKMGASPLEDTPFCQPSLILDRLVTTADGSQRALRIGLFSTLPPPTVHWEGQHLNGHYVRDIVETAAAYVPALREAGADIVVALCHSGISNSTHECGMENAILPLARHGGIDAIIAGHAHQSFPGPDIGSTTEIDNLRGSVCGIPVVMPGFRGSHLGIIDLELAHDTARGWQVSSFRASARPVYDRNSLGQLVPLAANDPKVEKAVQDLHEATTSFVRCPIGHSDRPLHSYFARVTDTAALDLIHKAQLEWLDEALSGTEYETLPRLSAASPFKSGGRGGPLFYTNVPAGALQLRHINDLYHFPNTIRALVVNGSRVMDWLEQSAAQFRQVIPGRVDQPLLDPDVPAYRFETIAGLSFEIDISAPARYDANFTLLDPGNSRIRNLNYQGKPVAPDDRFAIASHSFRVDGHFGRIPADEILHIASPPTLNSDVLRSYVMRRKHISPRPTHHWRIAPLPHGTAAWFDTGPDALRHASDETALQIEPLRETPQGFLRCRVTF